MPESAAGCFRSSAPSNEFSRATTAEKFEIDWYWVMISENAATSVAKAMADWLITPNSISLLMNAGAMIKAGMIWIIQL